MSFNCKLSLLAGIIFFATTGFKSNGNYNAVLLRADVSGPAQIITFFDNIERASFKYTSATLFKTGKVPALHSTLTADSTIHYDGKKYLTRLKYYAVQKKLFGFGSLTTSNSSVLLFTKDNQFQTLEVNKAGSYEFIGVKDDNYYFRFIQKNDITYISLRLNQPTVRITEYTVESE